MDRADSGYIADYFDISYSQGYYANGDSFKVLVKAKDAGKLKGDGYKLSEQAEKLEYEIAEDQRPALINSLDQLDEASRKTFDEEAQAIFRSYWNNTHDVCYLTPNHGRAYTYEIILQPGAILEKCSILTLKSSGKLDLQDVIDDKYTFNHVLLQYKLNGKLGGKENNDMHTVVCLSNVCKNPDGSFSYDNSRSFTLKYLGMSGPAGAYAYPLYYGDAVEDVILGNFGQNYQVDTISADGFWQKD